MRQVAIALVSLAFVGLGCGSESSDGNGEQISGSDKEVVAKIERYVEDWNRAATKWNAAYKSGDGIRFLRVHDRYLKRFHEDSIRILLTAEEIDDEELRRDLARLGRLYRNQFQAFVSVSNTVVNADLKAGQRALARLQRAAERKAVFGVRLARRYPELREEL